MSQPEENDIRYICLSDTHFGETDSLLTCLREQPYDCNPHGVSAVTAQLVEALQDLIARNRGSVKPTLILNGDILDLAFSSIGHALKQFEGFLARTIKPGEELFDRIVYLPGNHDHHIWEIARETQYVNKELGAHWHDELPDPDHTTPLNGGEKVPSYLLNQLIRHVRGLDPSQPADFDLSVVYPNLALIHDHEDRGVLIHHGHYCEAKYWVISKVRRWLFPDRDRAKTVHQLEGENFAWIDFVWSLLGRSGEAGAAVETLYKKLQYERHADAFIDEISERIAKAADIPFVPSAWLETKVLKSIFRRLAQVIGSERLHNNRRVSDEIDAGLRKYLFGPAYRQLNSEIGRVPDDLTFIFGHTHKPFEEGFDDLPQGSRLTVYNTGGWTVDSAQPSANYGAAIALVSTSLRVASIRVFNHGAELKRGVRVTQVADADASAAAFADEVSTRLGVTPEGAATSPPWQKLSRKVDHGVDRRRKHLAERFLNDR